MAGITNVRRLDVGREFTRCHHVVMTANTRALHFIVVHIARGYWGPRIHRVMTRFTQIRRVDMVNTLARGQYAVVTTDAGLGADRGVIKGGDKPIGAAMAHITGLYCRNMRGTHARGDGAIVTTRTGTGDLRMIHIGGQYRHPGVYGGMAGIAHVGGGNVGSALSGGAHTIVTTDAGLRAYGGVIKG